MVDIKGGGVTFYEGMDPALFRLSYGDGFRVPRQGVELLKQGLQKNLGQSYVRVRKHPPN